MAFTETTTFTWLFVISEWVIRLVLLIVVPLRRTPSAAKGWLLLIFFEPWLGLACYVMFGRARLPRWQRERVAQLRQVLAGITVRFTNHPNIFHPQVGPTLSHAVTLAENLGQSPILGGNSVELLSDYNGNFARLAADIDQAKNHVHLLFFILADDRATAPVLDALIRAAARGVKCRVLADAIGSRTGLRTLVPKLTAANVAIHEMLPVSFLPWRMGRMDLRNHRKIAIIDGRVGYTGSQNLVDSQFIPGLVYEDLMVRITGPVVLELQHVFAADWFKETGVVLNGDADFPPPQLAGEVAAQVLPSGPAFPIQNNQRIFVALLHGARQRVVLTTPYFVPDEPLLQAMQTAALRGVEVHLVVSERCDNALVTLAQESYFEELLESGLRIHRYKKNLLHAKHLSIDDAVAVIGTSNLDIRSFALNAEVMLMIYDKGVTARLIVEEDRYFANSQPLTRPDWQQRSFGHRLAQNLARLLSPLL